MAPPSDAVTAFEGVRPHLRALAYRMTGSLVDAEDLVQEAYLRYEPVADEVAHPRAFLSKMLTRMCLDHLKSARSRREHYVGTWLPEPVVGEEALSAAAATELADDISVALMLALERLTPLERAAFLLHDVFDVEYAEIARSLDRSEAACRKLAERARTQLKAARPGRPKPTVEEGARVVQAFVAATMSGDVTALSAVLTQDAVLYSDGGGRVSAARHPVRGALRVARFFVGVQKKLPTGAGITVRHAVVNGLPGLVLESAGGVIQTMAFDVADGKIAAVYAVRNPDKLASVPPPREEPGTRAR